MRLWLTLGMPHICLSSIYDLWISLGPSVSHMRQYFSIGARIMANPWGFLGLPEIQEFSVVTFSMGELTWRQTDACIPCSQRDLRQFECGDPPSSMDSSQCAFLCASIL
jgi:hypothetical protein